MFVEPITLHKIIEINAACAKITGWSCFYIFLFGFRSLVIIIFVENAYLIIINVEMVTKIQICIHDFPDDFL